MPKRTLCFRTEWYVQTVLVYSYVCRADTRAILQSTMYKLCFVYSHVFRAGTRAILQSTSKTVFWVPSSLLAMPDIIALRTAVWAAVWGSRPS